MRESPARYSCTPISSCVTNHLGNVQAVVLDKKWGVDLTGDTTINRYRPSLMAAYDYYPFGMLMPGRYVNDTAQQCATITQTKLVPKWTYTYYIPKWECVGNCGFTKVKPAYTTFSFLYAGTEEAVLQVNTTTSAAGLQKFVAVTRSLLLKITIRGHTILVLGMNIICKVHFSMHTFPIPFLS